MPADNVTPFRPRKPPPRQKPTLNLQSHRGKAVLAEALTALCFVLSYFFVAAPWSYLSLAPGIAALFIGSSNQHTAMPWAATHHLFVVRTVVIGSVALTLFSLLTLAPFAGVGTIVFWGRLAACVWAGGRAIIGLALAVLRKPIPHPTGFLL